MILEYLLLNRCFGCGISSAAGTIFVIHVEEGLGQAETRETYNNEMGEDGGTSTGEEKPIWSPLLSSLLRDSNVTIICVFIAGRWTQEEHALFLQGLREHGKEWKKIALMIPTRTVVQIRTHAQKYYQKLAKVRVGASERCPATYS